MGELELEWKSRSKCPNWTKCPNWSQCPKWTKWTKCPKWSKWSKWSKCPKCPKRPKCPKWTKCPKRTICPERTICPKRPIFPKWKKCPKWTKLPKCPKLEWKRNGRIGPHFPKIRNPICNDFDQICWFSDAFSSHTFDAQMHFSLGNFSRCHQKLWTAFDTFAIHRIFMGNLVCF